MNRHQRRKRSLLRKAEQLRKLEARRVIADNRLRLEKTRDNLSQPWRGGRSPKGMGNLGFYTGAGKPVGFTRPFTYSKGPAK
jgi:hypothetical protein